jgi:hypothetical protein
MSSDSSKWQWEVLIEGREVIARGLAETEDRAREHATEEARKAKLNFPWGTPIRIKLAPLAQVNLPRHRDGRLDL